MTTSKEYAAFILEQLDDISNISSRKMMGEYLLYYRDKVFGGIYDNRFLVKITDTSRSLMKDADEEIPYPGAKPMLLVDDVYNKEFLNELICKMYDDLPVPKPKKKSVKSSKK